jgi:hypothetical protein
MGLGSVVWMPPWHDVPFLRPPETDPGLSVPIINDYIRVPATRPNLRCLPVRLRTKELSIRLLGGYTYTYTYLLLKSTRGAYVGLYARIYPANLPVRTRCLSVCRPATSIHEVLPCVHRARARCEFWAREPRLRRCACIYV